MHDHLQGVQAHWLGQAGFLFEGGGLRVLVDPYLSDSLAIKYRGGKYPHARMCPPPVAPGELRDIDFVLASHSHSDHLDPLTLPAIASTNPECRFVIPESCRGIALERGIPEKAILTVNVNDRLALGGSNVLTVMPSAHEELTQDKNGHFLHLGYILELGGIRLYHSGDCSPYPGLAESLASLRPDIAFLPVNGRDEARTANGIIGNFTLSEAVDLVLQVPFGIGVGHHFGMFDFNTIDVDEARRYLSSRPESEGRFILAEAGTTLVFSPLAQT
jgi:L-ascorbate metabolism protein UlaG (beta-lactamase superfamily)